MRNDKMEMALGQPGSMNSANATILSRNAVRWIAGIASLLCLIASALLFVTNVSTSLTAKDIEALEGEVLNLDSLPRPQSYEDEIRLIRTVQKRVFAKAPFGTGIPEFEPREPGDLLKHGRGLCFDRSRTLDKAFTYLGFKARHVFLLYRKDMSLFSTFLRRGHPSHAVTEVKTSRGWLYVDSNQPWIAINHVGEPVGAGGIWKQFDELDNAPEYVRGPWWAIRGLYSRKGAFYEPFFPLPQLNWMDFTEWAIEKLNYEFQSRISSVSYFSSSKKGAPINQ